MPGLNGTADDERPKHYEYRNGVLCIINTLFDDVVPIHTVPNLDAPRLRKALEHITAHPEEHDQDMWAKRTPCGTSACLAGHVVTQAGYTLVFQHENPIFEQTAWCSKPGYPWNLGIPGESDKLLGLDEHGHALYRGENTLKDLWHLAHAYSGGEIEIPLEFL